MHCDTLTVYPHLRHTDGQVSFARLHEAGAGLQCFAAFLRYPEGQLLQRALSFADKLVAEVAANADIAQQVHCLADLERAAEEGKVGVLFTVEEGGVLEGDPANLAVLRDKGMRMMTLTWNYPNELGYPNCDAHLVQELGRDALFLPERRGLTPTGRQVVETMNDLGIVVDVSHLSDGGFWEALRLSRHPVVASHSNARAIAGASRNLTDDMIAALSAAGGVMGLNFCPDFLTLEGEDLLSAALRHVRHIYDVGGEDVLALGTDFDGIAARTPLDSCAAVPFLYDAVCRALSPRVADKMMWSNFVRVFGEVCG